MGFPIGPARPPALERRRPARQRALLGLAALLIAAAGLAVATVAPGTGTGGGSAGRSVGAVSRAHPPVPPPSPVVTVTIGAATDAVLSPGFVSLSMEGDLFNSGAIAAGGRRLQDLVHALHPGVLRVGANTGDEHGLTPHGVAALAALAAGADVKVVLALPLVEFDPAAAASLAVSARHELGRRLIALEVGNEPDSYGVTRARPPGYTWAQFRSQRGTYLRALRRAGVDLPVWGPDSTGGAWLALAARDPQHAYTTLTPHFYALSACHHHGATAADLLGPGQYRREELVASGFAATADRAGVGLVIGESNSAACGGVDGVSDRAAAAFWSLDFTLLAAREGLDGVLYHVGLTGCRGYSPVCATGPGADGRWVAGAEYPALALLHTLRGGRFLATTLTGYGHNLRAYSLAVPDGSRRLVLIDCDPAGAPPVRVDLAGPAQPDGLTGNSLTGTYLTGTYLTASDYAAASARVTTRTSRGGEVVLRPAQAAVLTLAAPTS